MFLYKLMIVIKLHNNNSIIYLIYSFDLQMRNHIHDAYMSWIRIVTYFSRIYSFENPAKQVFFFFFFSLRLNHHFHNADVRFLMKIRFL